MSNAPFQLDFTDQAVDGLKKLDKSAAKRVMKKLRWLVDNADMLQHIDLTGPLSGYYKLRVGDCRAIYSLDREDRIT